MDIQTINRGESSIRMNEVEQNKIRIQVRKELFKSFKDDTKK